MSDGWLRDSLRMTEGQPMLTVSVTRLPPELARRRSAQTAPRAWRGEPGFADQGGAAEPGFAIGSVTGYRWWALPRPDEQSGSWEPGELRGMHGTWGTGLLAARCIGDLAGGAPEHSQDGVPEESCSCVSPATRVLTTSLEWVPAGDLVDGEHVFAFDETPADRGYGRAASRKYREAVIACTDRATLPCYDLRFEDGTEVRASADHRWLVYNGDHAARWVRTDELRAGELRVSRIVKPFDPWETDNSREAGYLAAAFDGEGNLFQGEPRYQFKLGFAQADNPMLAETERYLKELGFEFAHRFRPRDKLPLRADGSFRLDQHLLEMTARPEMLRFLGSVRPVRLLPKLRPGMLGRMNMAQRVRLVSKVYAGEKEIVKLGTTAGTYFAEGLASHNCGFWAYWEVPPRHSMGAMLPVLGVIEGSGKTLIGETGFRCAQARIRALHLPDAGLGPDLHALAENRIARLYPQATLYRVLGAMTREYPPDPESQG